MPHDGSLPPASPTLPLTVWALVGVSGAGLQTATAAFCSAGWRIIDGLRGESDLQQVAQSLAAVPPAQPLLLVIRPTPHTDLVALAAAVQPVLTQAAAGQAKTLWLYACDEALVCRFMAAEKAHPWQASDTLTLLEAIQAERSALEPLRQLKDYSIDTSAMAPGDLTRKIRGLIGVPVAPPTLQLHVVSFGFKYGVPLDAEWVLDARFIPNPFYQPDLRPLTGQDAPIHQFMAQYPEAQTFLTQLTGLLQGVIPSMLAQGRSHMTVAIGCTGGQHRSVYFAEKLAAWAQAVYPTAHIACHHRESTRWGTALSH
jgi:UPF0042 nucleotide-binding protein